MELLNFLVMDYYLSKAGCTTKAAWLDGYGCSLWHLYMQCYIFGCQVDKMYALSLETRLIRVIPFADLSFSPGSATCKLHQFYSSPVSQLARCDEIWSCIARNQDLIQMIPFWLFDHD